MTDRYKLLDKTRKHHGVTLRRIYWIDEDREGGWLGPNANLPQDTDARVYGDALLIGGVFRDGEFWDGMFRDGEFWGGEFYDGWFDGGTFRGGYFYGGEFYDGTFRNGLFYGGEFWGGEFLGGWFFEGWFKDGVFRNGWFKGGDFWGGEFRDGEFYDGAFWDGVFYGGEFYSTPCTATRSDGYTFTAKVVDGDLRIWAGCRNFSWEEAVAHWNDDHRHGAETQRIIHFLKSQAEAEAERDARRE